MTDSRVYQDLQVRNSETYDDTLTTGPTLETPGSADAHIEWDLNALRTLVRLITGKADWHTAPAVDLETLATGGATASDSLVVMSQSQAVPTAGTLYLKLGDAVTSDVALVLHEAATIQSVSVAVNTADATNDYDVEVLVNAAVVATLSLTSTNAAALVTGLSAAVAANDQLAARLVRSAGSGKSDFKRAVVGVQIA